jgi:hypothetical protein
MFDPNAIADAGNRHPQFHLFVGVGGDLIYARRPRSSPPVVFSDTTIEGLEEQIITWEKEH